MDHCTLINKLHTMLNNHNKLCTHAQLISTHNAHYTHVLYKEKNETIKKYFYLALDNETFILSKKTSHHFLLE